jgi:hypothetical protein
MAKAEFKQMLIEVRRLWGQVSTDPSGVLVQSSDRRTALVSELPGKTSLWFKTRIRFILRSCHQTRHNANYINENARGCILMMENWPFGTKS